MMHKQVNYNKKFKLKLFLRLLMTVSVVTGISTIAFTASTSDSQQKSTELSYFDPFALETVYLGIADNEISTTVSSNLGAVIPLVNGSTLENSVITRPPIRVPYRPPLRSPYRPPFDPGPPSWYPGDPPWIP